MKKILVWLYINLEDFYRTLINDIVLPKLKEPMVVGADKAIELIVNAGYSMCRFGDGEFSLIRGENLKFQKYTTDIRKELLTILQLPSEKSKVLVCIPDVFKSVEQYVPRAQKYWKKYLHKNRKAIYHLLRFERVYYDTQITRFYIDYKDKSSMLLKVQQLKKIWEGKKVLFVEGERSRLGMGNDFFDNVASIKRIICPVVNAYERIDEIESHVLNIQDVDLVMIALGPTATVLAYRLHNRGIQALDIGHIDIEYEWFLKGVDEKEPVKHKYIGEMPGGDIVDDIVDEKYKAQIVEKIL